MKTEIVLRVIGCIIASVITYVWLQKRKADKENNGYKDWREKDFE